MVTKVLALTIVVARPPKAGEATSFYSRDCFAPLAMTTTLRTSVQGLQWKLGHLPVRPFLRLSLVLAIALLFSTSFAEEKVDARKLFDTHCKKCHGELGKPTERGQSLKAPDFTDRKFQESITDAQIRSSITNGKNKMPSWKDILSTEEIEAVGKWVRVFKPRR